MRLIAIYDRVGEKWVSLNGDGVNRRLDAKKYTRGEYEWVNDWSVGELTKYNLNKSLII
jgi:hypothetical protein